MPGCKVGDLVVAIDGPAACVGRQSRVVRAAEGDVVYARMSDGSTKWGRLSAGWWKVDPPIAGTHESYPDSALMPITPDAALLMRGHARADSDRD